MASRRYRSSTIIPAAKGERLSKIPIKISKEERQELECEEEIKRREESNRERAKERQIIEAIAKTKREKQNETVDILALPPVSSYEKNTAKSPNRRKIVEEAVRYNSSVTRLAKEVKQIDNSVCKGPISREELISYIEQKEPKSFTFADVPNQTNKAFIAYHSTIIEDTEVPIYSTYTTSLQKIRPSRRKGTSRPKQKGEILLLETEKNDEENKFKEDKYYVNLIRKKKREELVMHNDIDEIGDKRIERYFPTYEYSFNRDDPILENNTIKDLLSRYEPGMLLDPKTLIGVLKMRNCQSSIAGYGETKSYDQLELWIAETLELQEEVPLTYLIGVLDSPTRAEELYGRCVEEDQPCKDILINELIKIRRQYWEPLSDRSPRVPESLRR